MGRPPIGERAMTAAEKQRRYRERKFGNRSAAVTKLTKAAAIAAPLEARIRELEAELTSERQRCTMLKAGLQALRRQRIESKPKAAKPPLPPDEARDRRIKALVTQVRNLKGQVAAMAEWHKRRQPDRMSFQTRGAVLKCLHPDQRDNATDADRDKACRLFTAWLGDAKAVSES